MAANGRQTLELGVNGELRMKAMLKMCITHFKENCVPKEGEENAPSYVSVQMLVDTFSVAQRLTQNGYFFRDFVTLIGNYLDSFKNSGKNLNLELESNICEFLSKNNYLIVEDAENIYEKTKDKRFIPEKTKDYFFTYILQKNKDALQDSQVLEEAQNKIQELETKIQDVDGKIVLTALASLLRFPPELIRHNQSVYLMALKDQISFGNSS